MKIYGFKCLAFVPLVTLLLACSVDNESLSTALVTPLQTFELPEHLQLAESENLSGTWLVMVDSHYRYREGNGNNQFAEQYRLQSRKILTIREEAEEIYMTDCAALQAQRYRLEGNIYVLDSEASVSNNHLQSGESRLSFSDFNRLSGSFEHRSEQLQGNEFLSIESASLQGIKISNSMDISALSEDTNGLLSIGSASTGERQWLVNSDYAINCYELTYRTGSWRYDSPVFTDTGSHQAKSLVFSAYDLAALATTQETPAVADVVMRYRRTHSSGLETDAANNVIPYEADSSYLNIDLPMESLIFKNDERSYNAQLVSRFSEVDGDFSFAETSVNADINAITSSSIIDFRLQLTY